MKHDTHVLDGQNMDVKPPLNTYEDFLRLVQDIPDELPNPVVEKVQLKNGKSVYVVREDLLEVGSKARLAYALISACPEFDTFCYAQPKNGYAGISLSWAAKKLGKKCVLYVPEAKGPLSAHQERCALNGAEIYKKKIYGMSGLRKAARDHATTVKGRYIDMGMRGEPIATAALVRACRQVAAQIGEPKEVWSVLSTGQLTRSLQIAFPEATPFGVAVARNMHKGETGRLIPENVFSHPFTFHKNEAQEHLPPFPSAANYDAKAWRFIEEHASDGALFWNVAGQ